ncbi:TIGR02281 family clan AA aspartic protease [Amylibacter sp. SFDW26]|uniref:retropepsin-like aspartic protease family protein n=1 Tax=Amylibacter sp. SFDW26 TaxID=2652722 RepID=UPI001261B77F|nr:TIGR02281 family clan AA aspartic protease [Amylibacter sp. SFDW26]KAB7615824.1 TIGR02281 family clan AA aspartic protease [Amylibacter sp. SFDW26]
MTVDDKAHLFYMLILLVMVGGWFLYDRRETLSQSIQQALIWGLIFVGVIIAYGFKDVFQSQVFPSAAVQNGEGSITLSRANDGHFYATLAVNGQDIKFVVDTGATSIVLSKDDAQDIGIDVMNLNFLGQAYTANGVVDTASVKLNHITLGDITFYDMHASVNGGELFESLLGMDYINQFSEFKISGNTLTLTR